MVAKRADKPVVANSAPEVLQDEEKAFPRGGGSTISALDRRRIKAEAQADAERDFFAEASAAKRRKLGTSQDNDLSFVSRGIAGKPPKYVDLLKLKTLSPGAKLWGSVVEVHPAELVVSLPDGLRGRVPAQQASDVLAQQGKRGESLLPLTRLFHPGQLVRCVVTGLRTGAAAEPEPRAPAGQKRKRGAPQKLIELSLEVARVCSGVAADEGLREGMALPACVRSVEDHGYTLLLGPQGAEGFLRKKDHEAAYGQGAMLEQGALLECVVMPGSKGRLVKVTTDPEAVAHTVTKDQERLNISSLLPGALVNARVRHILGDGLQLSFLTYFSGTVDIFHLAQEVPDQKWRERYSEGQKLRARIIYVDVNSKKVGLSLLAHLMAFTPKSGQPAQGELFEDAIVRRISPNLGLALELPTEPSPRAGFAHVSNVLDNKSDKLEKAFKVGQAVRARVIGSRPFDGLAVLSLKPGMVDQQAVQAGDLQLGASVAGEVIKVEDYGLLVKLGPGTRALVPMVHVSETSLHRLPAHIKPGQKVTARVWEVNPNTQRATLTLRKGLLKSKLPVLAQLKDAEPGTRTHGIVTGVKEYGVFVALWGGLKGLAHSSELGLAPGQTPQDSFQEGQVVKCRVLRADIPHQRLSLSLAPKSSAPIVEDEAPAGTVETQGNAAQSGGAQPGDVVSDGVVSAIETEEQEGDAETEAVPTRYTITFPGSIAQGLLAVAHLADSATAVAELRSAIKVGDQLGDLLVLERLEASGNLRVSRKRSLVAGAATMPRAFADVKLHLVAPGYVHSVAADAVYVHFLGRVSGRAGLPQLSDVFVSDPRQHFKAGQSVRAQVVQVDAAKERFLVTLKSSAVGSKDASYLHGMFQDLEAAEALRMQHDEETEAIPWQTSLGAGSVIDVTVHEHKDYGIVCDFAAFPDLVGLASPHQVSGEQPAVGTALRACVLNANREVGIVDLSLLPRLVEGAEQRAKQGPGIAAGDGKQSKSRKRKAAEAALQATAPLKAGMQNQQAVVELLKDEFAVLSLPQAGHAIGFAATRDYNLQTPQGARQLKPGQHVTVSVAASASAETGTTGAHASNRPGPSSPPRSPPKNPHKPVTDSPFKTAGGRLLLHYPLQQPASHDRSERSGVHIEPGTVQTVNITAVHMDHLEVATDSGVRGRVDITQLADPDSSLGEHPLQPYSEGQTLTAVALGLHPTAGSKHAAKGVGQSIEFSALPALLAAAEGGQKPTGTKDRIRRLQPGQKVLGYIVEASEQYAMVHLDVGVRGRLSVLDSSSSPEDMGCFAERFALGQHARAAHFRVVQVDASKGTVDLSLVDVDSGSATCSASAAAAASAGTVLPGCIETVSGAGLKVQLAPRVHGFVPLTELHAGWVDNALEGFTAGQYVRCTVVTPSKAGKPAVLSLRQPGAAAAVQPQGKKQKKAVKAASEAVPRLALAELKEGLEVRGYVRSVSPAGVFVCLSNSITARVRLSNLADTFVEDPKAEFPEGRLVEGKVISTTGDKVEISLKKKSAVPDWMQLEQLQPGQVVRGKIKRVEAFGVFVQLHNSSLTGLAHKSELSDDFVKDPADVYQASQGVRAVVLEVDKERHRLSLGLKASYFADVEEPAQQQEEEDDLEEAMLAVADSDEDDLEVEQLLAAHAIEDSATDGDVDEGMPAGLEAAAADGSEEAQAYESDDSDESDEDEPAAGVATGAGHSAAPVRDLGPVGWEDPDSTAAPMTAAAPVQEPTPEEARRLSKAQRRRQKAADERAVQQQERALAAGEQDGPQSAAQHEQAIMAQPDASIVWIQYMAFLISLGEVEKARGLAERAVQTINYRQEQEKFNIWVAWLNLESKYGEPTPEEALTRLFQRALTYCDQKKLYLALVDILDRTGQEGEVADQTLRALTRKFGGSAKVWLRQVQWHLARDQGEQARKTLDRALNSLPKRKHIKVITRGALLHFKMGSEERARSLFEGCLRNYPARLDLWSQYLDQEIKLGDAQRTRALFERAIHLQLKAKQMKFLFKRYLQYEQQHGDEATVAHVKEAALAYVNEHVE